MFYGRNSNVLHLRVHPISFGGVPVRRAFLMLVTLLALLPFAVNAQTRRIVEMGITSPEMAQYFQQHASAQDIARVDHPNDIGLISGITVGKKMVIFKSASQIQQFLASNANSLDIVGYNLEPGQTHDANELANPVAAAKAVRSMATQYGKAVAIGLTHDLTLQYAAAMAPYADIWVLQIQKAQNDAQMAGEFVNQMVPALQRANPAIQVFVQIRTDSSPAALAKLVNGLGNVHVSILTQRSDVQDAVNVAGAFFGGTGQTQMVSQAPASWVNDYGYRIPSKDGKWLLPVATRLLGSTDDDHVHRGSINSWDLSAAIGSPVFAAAPGVVEAAGCYLYEQHKWAIMQGYGCAVQIRHGGGISSQYGHCLEGSIRVKAGDQVTASTLLCQVGKTGVTSFNHTHFTILRNGSPVRMDSIFDKGLMRYCHLCSGKNDPNAPIAGGMPTGQQQSQQSVTAFQTRYDQLLTILRQYPPQLVSLAIMALLGLLALVYWLGGRTERVVIVAVVAGMAGALVIVWLFMPIGVVASGAGQQTAVSGGDAWEWAYAFMRKWEGGSNPPCVHDPVRTLKGITQATYTAWLRSQGQPNADVCAALTEQQAEAIYYQRYWLASGADKLKPAAALVVFDHAVNAGVGEGKALIAQCGSNVSCLVQARYADYKTKGNCAQYCKAWFGRVADLVKYLQKGQS